MEIEDRIYVLRFPRDRRAAKWRWHYYTGEAPTDRIGQAKVFNLQQAKNTKQFAFTTTSCEIKRITNKMLFIAALEGK